MTSHDAVPDRLIIAIGGNAIHPEGIRGTAEEQEKLAAETGAALDAAETEWLELELLREEIEG